VIELPDGLFTTLVADPPWPYGDALPGKGRGAKKHYGLLSMDEIAGMGSEVTRVVTDNAHLYLWTTNAFVAESWQVARDWGFVPKTICTWVKVRGLCRPRSTVLDVSKRVQFQFMDSEDARLQFGMGRSFRNVTEHLIFAVRGKLDVKRHDVPSVLFAPRRAHSEKPDEAYELVESMSPGPYLELFARRSWEGWSAWGDEVEG
jgi:N6-adenosine-specific RNA methylase IME4